MSLLGLPLSPQPEKDADNKRKDIRETITGIKKSPTQLKEEHIPHPGDPTMTDKKPSRKL